MILSFILVLISIALGIYCWFLRQNQGCVERINEDVREENENIARKNQELEQRHETLVASVTA